MSDESVSRYEPGSRPWRPDWPVEVDLHLHTTASDGTLSPTALIQQILETSLRTVAVTDHDSTEGIDEAMAAGRDVVSSGFIIPYPPGFPILVPGQVISPDILDFMRKLDVKEIHGYRAELGLRVFTDEAIAAFTDTRIKRKEASNG